MSNKKIPVIGVRFKQAGKIYYFDAEDFSVSLHDHVVVETSRGIECGQVVLPRHFIFEDELKAPLKPIMRIATKEDLKQVEMNKQKALDAYDITREKISEHGLDMKLIDIELTFDGSKIIFYFTSDGRVDFRALVRDLAAIFRIRIELRQVGVRDEAKVLSGIGICGRELCCATFLDEFRPVTIRMAKEQGLSLNPSKISGVCGRLMCCLQYEEENYEYLNKRLPSEGDMVYTPMGLGKVLNVNVLREKVKVAILKDENDAPLVEVFHNDDIQKQRRHHKAKIDTESDEEA